MTIESNDFFYANVVILKWAGLWIPHKNVKTSLKTWYYIYNAFWITFSCVIFTQLELLSFEKTASNLEDLVKNVNMGMTHFLANIKVLLWFYKRKEILEILEILENYSGFYEDCGDFEPKKILLKEKKLKDIATKGFLATALSVSTTACLATLALLLLDNDVHYVQNAKNETVLDLSNHKLPYYSVIPFDYTLSKFLFSTAIVWQCLAGFNFGWMIVGFDTFYVAILSYICAHLLIIQGAFKTIRARCLQKLNLPEELKIYNSDILNKYMNEEMNIITKHLQIILNVCSRLENIYTYITLAQILISLVVFCTCLFMVSSIPITSAKFGTELFYLIAIENQLAIYCVFGNKVTLSGEGIPSAIYDGDWFASDASFKRSMLISMSRMHRPIYFTMGKFSPLTLSTFVNGNLTGEMYLIFLRDELVPALVQLYPNPVDLDLPHHSLWYQQDLYRTKPDNIDDLKISKGSYSFFAVLKR